MKSPKLFSLLEFYREDFEIFRELGWEVQPEHRLWRAAFSQADVLYAWWGATALPAVLIWRLRGKICIVTGAVGLRDRESWSGAGPPPLQFRLRRWLQRTLMLWASRLATCTIAVSDIELQDLRTAGIERTELAHHSVDGSYYEPCERSSSPVAITVGQCNRFSIFRKGIDVCVASTEIVRRQYPDYRLVIVGPVVESGRQWLDEARKRFDFSGIEIRGEVSRQEKRTLLQSSWIYLQPSVYEGFGVSVVEAMACGSVVVCSSNGALPEVVDNCGIVLEERTPEELAAGVVRLLSDERLRRDLSACARSRAEFFSRANRKRRLSEVLETVVGSS